MKRIFIILILSPLLSQSQSKDDLYSDATKLKSTEIVKNNNFEFEPGERIVKWVKIYDIDANISFSILKDYFIRKNNFESYNVENETITAKLLPKNIDIQKYGYTSLSTPMVFGNEHRGNFRLEYKKGKYRVTINDIEYIDNGSFDIITKSLVSQYAPTSKGDIQSYNGDYSFRNDGTIRTRNKTIYEILDKYFTDISQFKIINNNENW